jgi:hypothetical protein
MIFSNAKSSTAQKQLYSIAGLLRGREFVGRFEVGDLSYQFTYSPARVELVAGKLQLRGRLAITDQQGHVRSRAKVLARLAGTQGGVGTSPIRRASSSNERQAIKPEEAAKLPEVESSGRLAFTGVMYFHFEPLDGQSLGVAADLSRIQLNARLAPTDDTARKLHGLYSSLVEALYEEKPQKQVVEELLKGINKLLKG